MEEIVNEQKSVKKLVLKKETVSNLEILSREELNDVKAAFDPCWENLYTVYYCRLIRTGGKPAEPALYHNSPEDSPDY
jgi:hypothetical protein